MLEEFLLYKLVNRGIKKSKVHFWVEFCMSGIFVKFYKFYLLYFIDNHWIHYIGKKQKVTAYNAKKDREKFWIFSNSISTCAASIWILSIFDVEQIIRSNMNNYLDNANKYLFTISILIHKCHIQMASFLPGHTVLLSLKMFWNQHWKHRLVNS